LRDRAPPPPPRLDALARRLEGDGEVSDSEKRLGHQPMFFLGSNASRTASPMKTRRLSMTASVMKAVKPSHGACRLFLPCASSSPSEGEPAGRPKPRKSREGSVRTPPRTRNGRDWKVAA